MVDLVRLGVCHFPPFTYIQGAATFGPWIWAATNAVDKTYAAGYDFVHLDDESCTMTDMLVGLRDNMFDVAVHPMLMDAECDGCEWTYPLSTNGLVSVIADDSGTKTSIFTDVFEPNIWRYLFALAAVFVTSAVGMEWSRKRWRHIAYSFLSLTTNLHVPEDIAGGTYFLYMSMVVCSTMTIALYTAEVTSTILQEKTSPGLNIRGLVNSGKRFSVVDGGPSVQMAYEFPDAKYDVLPQASALASLPTLMLYEQGEMMTRAACDPLVSRSGAINRLAYSMAFRQGFSGKTNMNDYFRDLTVTDTMEATMTTWLNQKYQCVDEQAVQIDAKFMEPFLWASLCIFAFAVICRFLPERQVSSEEDERHPTGLLPSGTIRRLGQLPRYIQRCVARRGQRDGDR